MLLFTQKQMHFILYKSPNKCIPKAISFNICNCFDNKKKLTKNNRVKTMTKFEPLLF